MKNILKAAIYVGTYAKYNNGSIAGSWLKLADYTTKRAFYAACKELHKSERDPEFMFQDWENIPDSMISESSVSDEVWHVLNSLKKFAAGRDEEFASWCDDNGFEQDYNSLREFLGFVKNNDKKPVRKNGKKDKAPAQSKDDMKQLLLQAFRGDASSADYYTSEASGVYTVAGLTVLVTKPKIETRFCFDDENEDDLKTYRHFTEDYFIKDNLHRANALKALDYFEGKKELYYGRIPCLVKTRRNSDLWEIATAYNTEIVESRFNEYRRLTDDEMKQVHDILLTEKQKFVTRLQSYLKRYGLTKVHTWTYYANA